MHDPAALRSLHLARFQAEPAIFVAPGRVNLIGEHTDYAEGFVMPAAIDFATLAGISPRSDGKIVLYSENYGEERTFEAAALPAKASQHWTDYPLGVVAILAGEGHAIPGFSLSLWGDVPLGSGLSSSASLEVVTALAVLWFIGVRCWHGFASGQRTSLWAPIAASWTSSSPPTAPRTTPCCWIAGI
jgi:galactokinase